MKRWQTFLGCSLLILATAAVRGAEKTAEAVAPARIAELVRQLGSDEFTVREEASQRLLKVGLPAKSALLEGAKSLDLEIRRRCRELLPAILEADRQARLAAFLADKEGKQKHDLPCWERYRKIAGEDATARQFFVEMQKADIGLLAEVEKDPARAGARCGSLCQAVTYPPHRERTLTEFATLLLVASDPRVTIPSQHRYLFSNLLYQMPVRNELKKSSSTPFRKIVLAWMERQAEDPNTAANLFSTINNLEMKEGLDLATKLIRSKKIKGAGVAHALVTIGKLGNKDQVPLLEGFLEDKTEIGGFGIGVAGGKAVSGQTQVRDAALAMLVHVTKQAHKDYGFALSKANNNYLLFNAAFLGFSSNEERDKAFAKWKAWKAAQKK